MIKAALLESEDFSCPYFRERTATYEHFLVFELDNADLEILLANGYRHFGQYFFRPACRTCHDCIPIRIPLNRFTSPGSMKRLFKKNREFKVKLEMPKPSVTAFNLFRWHSRRFSRPINDSYQQYIDSFYFPFSSNRMLTVKDGERLIAVSHVDVTSGALSAVYCYFDEDYARHSPGSFAIYKEVEIALSEGKNWLYLGYYLRDNPHMNYKTRFRPNQLLIDDMEWLDYMDLHGRVLNPKAVSTGFSPGQPLFAGQPEGKP